MSRCGCDGLEIIRSVRWRKDNLKICLMGPKLTRKQRKIKSKYLLFLLSVVGYLMYRIIVAIVIVFGYS